MGCFRIQDTSTYPIKQQSANLTIDFCRNLCRNHNYSHAYLHTGDWCFCGEEFLQNNVGDTECKEECSGDTQQICGDDDTVSVYNGKICSDICLLRY